MAILPASISEAANMNEVPCALMRGSKRIGLDDSPTFSSSRVSLKLKPLQWTGRGTNVPMRPPTRAHQMVGRGSRLTGLRCSSACFLSDANDNLQQQATLQQLRSARVIACLRASRHKGSEEYKGFCYEGEHFQLIWPLYVENAIAVGYLSAVDTIVRRSNLVLDAARAALDGGLTALEVTMNTPSAAQVIKVLVREYPSAIIGAGTVLSTKEADIAKDAGAQFLMSPVTVEEMVRDHRNGSVLYIPGAMTPTEVISAYNLGAPVVKLYPVALLGGVAFVRTLRKPLSHIPMIASNGISLDMVESYISAGAMAVILSESIFEKSALENNDMDRIRGLAGAAVSKATSCQLTLMPT